MTYTSLSLDLDNQWSYMKAHGDDGWQSYPSYLDVAVPRILEFLAARRLRISFFPGLDLPAARKLALAGELFDILAARFETVTMGEHAGRVAADQRQLQSLEPLFHA